MNTNGCYQLEILMHHPTKCPEKDFYNRGKNSRILVHTLDDSFWTDDIDTALAVLRDSMEEIFKLQELGK